MTIVDDIIQHIEKDRITFHSPITVSKENVSDLLCCAFEGGSNYWYMDLEVHRAKGDKRPSDYTMVPLTDNGYMSFIADDNPSTALRLDIAAIRKGLELLHENYPRHWEDFVNGDFDATTGDVFLQLCVFTDIVYG